MHIKEIKSQHRRDFRAVYACEHCGHEHEAHGYDDANFHDNVIPQMQCQECSAVASGDIPARATRHAAHEEV